MTIVANNSITVSNVNDGTITHTAWSYSADGTDRFTTVYPNLNLLVNSSAKTKDGFFKNFDRVENDYGEVTLKGTNTYIIRDLPDGFFIKPRKYKPGDKYTMSMDIMFTSWNLPVGTTLTEFWIGQRYVAGSWAQICVIDLPKNPSQMLNQWIRITQTSTIPPYPDPSVNTQTVFQTKFTGASEGSFTVRVRNPKQEQGSIATPYMQSASEVTTADWPKYIGQYTNFTQADSTNPSDYTWGPMRGDDGKDGSDGKDGIAGNDGKGIKATAITYQASTNGTTAPTGTWSASVPTVAKGSFLWTRTIWTYTDNTTETGYAVAYMGTNGNNGTNGVAGKDGVGIKTTTITYIGSTSGTTAPTSGWTSTVPTVAAGSYLWTKTVWAYTDNTSETGYSVARMGLKGDKGDQGIKGSDGTSGIIVSSVAPTSPQTGQLWQDTSTTPQLVKKWNGSSWVIWELYAQNLKADSLSALSANLGDVTAGTVTLMDDNWVINGQPKMYGIYQSKFGLISSGPTFSRSAIVSDSQMGIANLNRGELRFITTEYTEDLKTVQESGMSDPNTAFIKFNSYDDGKDVMLIGSSGDIVFKGNTSQDTPWITLASGVKYKFMFSRVYISVNVVGNGSGYMQFGTLPQNIRPISDQFMTISNWGAGTDDDRHMMVRASDGAVVLWAPKSGITYGGEVSYTL